MIDRGFDSDALDRHITGNYGEDQYRDYEFCDGCDQEIEDPSTHLMICKKNKHPSTCKGELMEDAMIAAGEARRDARNDI
jgi:hypothetical protein